MATLKAEVVELEIEDHPDADALEIAKVRGYQSIVRKGQYDTGDRAVYIPEQSIVPEWVLCRLNLWDDEKGKGGLAGKQGNRVKPVKLRGVLSQGLIFPLESYSYYLRGKDGEKIKVEEGDDVTELLGITKWEPPIPAQMSGEVANLHGKTLKYDIENVKNYPEIVDALINLGIEAEITEKLHGCIHKDTEITLVDGSQKTIHEIIHDENITEVMSYDVDKNEFIPRKITAKMARPNTENKKWLVLTLENGNKLRITEDHPVFSEDRGEFVAAKDIREGENIKSLH